MGDARGQVEEGESIQQAAMREVKEETGIDVEVIKFCGIFHNASRGVCNTLWLAREVGGELAVSEASLEVGYFTVAQALHMVTWKNFSERIQMCLDESTHPFYVDF